VFGVGPQEMLLIGLAALLIFGPGKLPEVMGQAGKLYKDFRNMTSELTGEFEKTVAEAREVGNQLTGDLGPMQKQVDSVTRSVQRDLGKGAKGTATSKKSAGTTNLSSASAKKSGTTSSRSSGTKTTSSKSTSSSRTAPSKTEAKADAKTSETSKKTAVAPVATKEDPYSDISVFTPTEPERARRARRATPSVISDRTPRQVSASVADAVESAGSASPAPVDDAIARARQRRRAAGYAQRSA
jgi:TatA/E family protein of Tat protein translocase